MTYRHSAAALLAAIAITSCGGRKPAPEPGPPAVYLESGLTPVDRAQFFELPMGTGIFEYFGFMAIEDPKTGAPFSQNLERFGFLSNPDAPDGLPVGLTIERPQGVPLDMIGLNCAACHVAEISYQGNTFRVDGAPNRIDLFAFKRDLVGAAKHTMSHPDAAFALLLRMATQHESTRKLLQETKTRNELIEHGELGQSLADELHAAVQREMAALNVEFEMAPPSHAAAEDATHAELAKNISAMNVVERSHMREHSGGDRERLVHDTLSEWGRNTRLFISWIKIVTENLGDHTSMTAPGPGRADAWGAVRNVLFEPRPLTAPSSIPPIWGIESYKWYQWNGTTNTNVQRGLAAAIGAGAYFDRRTGESPIRVDNIMTLESFTSKMAPPDWPDAFPPVDAARAERGGRLYETHCAECHDRATTAEGGLIEFPSFSVDELGTDPTYVRNFAEPAGDRPFADALRDFMDRMAQAYYADQNVSPATQEEWDPPSRRPAEWRAPLTYPARPLEGVWSTAPYLHNDSVPTLHDLLLPETDRPGRFYTGSREYDPERVGYRSERNAPGASFEFDTSIIGNSNAGHRYGTDLSEEERWDLIEYLKTK